MRIDIFLPLCDELLEMIAEGFESGDCAYNAVEAHYGPGNIDGIREGERPLVQIMNAARHVPGEIDENGKETQIYECAQRK